jgi:hypothetical protein
MEIKIVKIKLKSNLIYKVIIILRVQLSILLMIKIKLN